MNGYFKINFSTAPIGYYFITPAGYQMIDSGWIGFVPEETGAIVKFVPTGTP